MIYNVKGNIYSSCFPMDKVMSSIDKESLFLLRNKPSKYAFFASYKSIFGNKGFAIVGRIPDEFIDIIKQDPVKSAALEYCFSGEVNKHMPTNNRSRGRSNSRGRQGKKWNRGKQNKKWSKGKRDQKRPQRQNVNRR